MTKGFYGGGTYGWPTPIGGLGGGLYFDDHGNFYPQFYYGTPRAGISAGYSPDLEGFLTGTSVSGSFGGGPVRYNTGTSGGSAGFGFGTPGVGVTYGFGPYKLDPAPIDAIGEINPAIYSTGFDLPPEPQDSFGNRFGAWASSSARAAETNASYGRDSFDNRFGNWGSAPASDPGNSRSPVLGALERYRRSGAAGGLPTVAPLPPSVGMPDAALPNSVGDETQQSLSDKPERYLGRRVVTRSRPSESDVAPSIAPSIPETFADRFDNWTASPDGGIALRNPNPAAPQRGRPLGIVSGEPIPDWITPPPIFGQRDRSRAPIDEGREWLMRMIRSVGDY